MSVQGYSRGQIWLHWSVAVLLVVAFLSHDMMKEAWIAQRRGTEASYPILHIAAGVAVLALVLWRLVLRLQRGAPALPEGTTPLLALGSKAVHGLIYVLLVLIPVSGMVAWFGGLGTAAEAHEVMFNLGWVLVALHVLAALYHQYVLKDGLIRRMMRAG